MLITGKLRGQVSYFPPQNLTRTLGSRGDTRGQLRMPCASMAMSFASLPTSLFSSLLKRSSVRNSILTSQQFTDTPPDIYSPHQKNLEVFLKTNFQNRGKDLGGIVWEEDPVRHREVAKKLSPAFSNRSIKALEPLTHEYMDYFVAKMKELGSEPTGVGLVEWTNWLAMDQAADMAWNEKLHQMRDRRLSQESLASIVSRS